MNLIKELKSYPISWNKTSNWKVIPLAEIRPVNPPKVELKRKPIIKYKGVIKEKQEDQNSIKSI